MKVKPNNHSNGKRRRRESKAPILLWQPLKKKLAIYLLLLNPLSGSKNSSSI